MTQPAGDSPAHVDGRTAVVRQDLDNVLHPVVAPRQLEAEPLVIVEGRGSTVVDADGTEYLDAMAGLWCVNIGYGRTELADVAAAQMRALPYYPHTAINEPAAKLAQRVNGLLSGDNHVYFVASGSEANEAGFKFARQYTKHENPGQYRYKTISRYLGYHGTTLATLAAGGMGDRKMKFEPLGGNDFVHVAPPYCYRCPFGLTYPSCELACVKNIEATIQGEGPDTVSTVLVEPIMTAAGADRNIEIILRERLVERSAENGAYLLDGLRTLLKHPWVGDVRGKGLFAGVELVRDRRTKEAVPADRIKSVVDFARRNGVIVGRSGGGRHLGSTIVLSPPLVITRAEIDRVVAVLDKAIAEMGGSLGTS